MSGTLVNNAGLILVSPFLPALFESLQLVHNGQFIGEESAPRAALILQFVATGSVDSFEYELSLNKILCGIPEDSSLPLTVELTTLERETVDSMLKAVIGHWSVLGNTSVEGFRESFLNREGWVATNDNRLELTVQEAPFDMLIDQIPWSYQMIEHPWMNTVLHVDWR